MTEVRRVDGDELAHVVIEWLQAQPAVRLVVIEGLPGAGKSHLIKQIEGLHPCLELDEILDRPVPNEVPWTEAATLAGAAEALSELLARHPLVIVEGPAAWPVIASVAAKHEPAVRRI